MRDEDGGSENNSRIGTLRRCSTYLYIHIYILLCVYTVISGVGGDEK